MLDPTQTPSSPKVIIVGAGLGGLACAIACRRHGLDVLVVERAPEILPVGAGIQVPPNAARVMEYLGLLAKIKDKGTVLDSIILRRYENGKQLCCRPGGERVLEDFGAPWLVIHRADYHDVLLAEAMKLGVEIWLSAEASHINFDRTELTLSDCRVIQGDVIVGADGLWSAIRPLLLGSPADPVETGDLAYRATFSLEQLRTLNDPRIEELCSQNQVNVWLGPSKHCVFYPVRGGKQFNMVLLRPDNLPAGSRRSQGDLGEMRETFEGWDEILTKIMSCISSVLKWKLCHLDELQTWTKDRVALLGDSCHPTLPYQAQGAAMAVEDGAVLGELLALLARASTKSGRPFHSYLQDLLRLYETLRKSRTTLNVRGAVANQTMYHMHDGLAQEARDIALGSTDWVRPNDVAWADIGYQKSLLAWDAVRDSRQKFEKWWKSRLGESGEPDERANLVGK